MTIAIAVKVLVMALALTHSTKAQAVSTTTDVSTTDGSSTSLTTPTASATTATSIASSTATTTTILASTTAAATSSSSSTTRMGFFDEPEWVRSLRADVGTISPSASWIHSLPRSTISGEKGRNEPFGPAADGPYFDPFVSILVFCAVIGVLFAAAGVLFCVLRYVCECCGGDEPDPDGYSKLGILLPQISLIVFGLILLIIGLIGIYGTVLWNGAIDGVAADIKARGAVEGAAIVSVIDRVRAIDALPKPYDCDTFCNRTIKFGEFLDGYSKSGAAVRDEAASAESLFSTANITREALFACYLALLIVTVICAVVAAACKKSRVATAAAACSFLVFVFAWFTVGISFVLAIGASDWCFFNSTALVAAGPAAMIANDSSITAANKQVDIGNIFRASDNAAGNGTRQVIQFMLDDGVRINYINNASSPAAEVARLRAEDAELVRLQSNISVQRAGVWVIDAVAKHRDKACRDALDGNIYIAATALTVIILLIPFVICAFVAEKRFAADDDEPFKRRRRDSFDDNAYF